MAARDSPIEQTLAALREHGLTAAIGVWFTCVAGIAAAVTRKALSYDFSQLR